MGFLGADQGKKIFQLQIPSLLERRSKFKLSLFVIFFAVFTSSLGQTAQVSEQGSGRDALNKARDLAEKNDAIQSERIYHQLGWRSGFWFETVFDHIQMALGAVDTNRMHSAGAESSTSPAFHSTSVSIPASTTRAIEAWRLIQLLRRTHTVRTSESNRLQYFEALAAYLAGSCPLSYQLKDDVFANLLQASVYRSKFENPNPVAVNQSFSEMEQGTLLNSFSAGMVPFFADLAKTTLLRGSGCRLSHLLTITSESDKIAKQKSELTYLLRAIGQANQTNSPLLPRGLLTLALRAYALSKNVADQNLENELAKKISTFQAHDIIWLPDPERHLAFQARFAPVLDAKYKQHDSAGRAVFEILKNAGETESDWFGLLNLDSFSIADRIELLTLWRERISVPHHRYLLLKLAEAEYASGNAVKALQDLRQSFQIQDPAALGSEETESKEGDRFAENLAEQIFQEYRFDSSVSGAMQGALPDRLWRSLETTLLFDLAVRGDSKAVSSMLARQSKSFNLPRSQAALLDALAKRKLQLFSSVWRSFGGQGRYLSQPAQDFIRRVAHSLFALTQESRIKVLPFSSLLATALQEALQNSTAPLSSSLSENQSTSSDGTNFASPNIQSEEDQPNNVEEKQLLIHQLTDGLKSAWLKGNSSARAGTANLGVADLKGALRLKNPFKFVPVTNLPFAYLLLMPSGLVKPTWVLQ